MKKELLTKEQIKSYSGVTCPRCNTDNIESGSIDADGTIGISNVKCNACNLIWDDIWTLKGINLNTVDEDI